MESFPWFLKFWSWANERANAEKRQDLLLARIGHYWHDWFDDEPNGYRKEIEELCEKHLAIEAFVSDLKLWAHVKWPAHSQASVWLLCALARKEPFTQWAELAPYRELPEKDGTWGIFLHNTEGGSLMDVRAVRCLLIPKAGKNPLTSRSFRKFFSRWVWFGKKKPVSSAQLSLHTNEHQSLADMDAVEAGRQALQAVMTLLKGRSFWRFFCKWVLFGKKQTERQHMARQCLDWTYRALRILGWPVCIALFGFLFLADPFEYFTDDELLKPIALVFVTLSLLTMVSPILVESFLAWRQRKRWANLLRHSYLHLVIGEGEELKIFGPSFGLALYFSTLFALDNESPAQSQCLTQLINELKRASSSHAFTGKLLDNGQIEPVARLIDKIEAARACEFLQHFITPMQDEIQQAGHAAKHRLPLAPGEVCAAGKLLLQVQPYSEVMPLLQDMWASHWRAPRWKIIAAMVLWACLACPTGFTLISLTQRAFSQDPTLNITYFEATDPTLPDQTLLLVIQITGKDRARFTASLSSDYWANRPAKPFEQSKETPDLWTIEIRTENLRVNAVGTQNDAMIQLIGPRHFLGRDLPPKVFENKALQVFIDIKNEEIKKKEEDDLKKRANKKVS